MSRAPIVPPPPQVDIITPVYGGADFLAALGDSLLSQYQAGATFHWWVVDDATPPERGAGEVRKVGQELIKDRRVTVLRNRENGGYAVSNNLAASRKDARANAILLLNSDTLIMHDNWLGLMLENLRDPRVGVVGAKLLFFPDSRGDDFMRPPNCVQHAGVVFDVFRRPYHIFAGWGAGDPK